MALSRILNDWSEREESKVLINLIKTNWINRSQLQLLIYKVFWKLTNSVSKSVPPTAEIPCFLCEILPNGMATWNPDGRHVVQRGEREQSSPLSLFGGGNFRQLQMGTSSTWKGRRGGRAEELWRIGHYSTPVCNEMCRNKHGFGQLIGEGTMLRMSWIFFLQIFDLKSSI